MSGLPGTKGLIGKPTIFQDHPCDEGGLAADAHAYGSHGHRVLGRFLSGWEARRQRVGGQAREDLEHRNRSRGEQPLSVHLVKRCLGLGFQEGKPRCQTLTCSESLVVRSCVRSRVTWAYEKSKLMGFTKSDKVVLGRFGPRSVTTAPADASAPRRRARTRMSSNLSRTRTAL